MQLSLRKNRLTLKKTRNNDNNLIFDKHDKPSSSLHSINGSTEDDASSSVALKGSVLIGKWV